MTLSQEKESWKTGLLNLNVTSSSAIAIKGISLFSFSFSSSLRDESHQPQDHLGLEPDNQVFGTQLLLLLYFISVLCTGVIVFELALLSSGLARSFEVKVLPEYEGCHLSF